MKYGRLVFSREFVSSSTVCNVGDFVQTLAIDLLYKEMGIAKEDTVDIPFQSLASYKGEKVLLPLNGYFYYNREYPSFPLSEDITPVFLGLYTTSKEYLKHSSFWKNAGVIGCRDEATYEAVKKYGYGAYLTGCMTVLFPKREKAPENGKVFIVDAHPSIDAYIPEEIKKNAEYVSHEITVNDAENVETLIKECETATRKMYERYYNEASLVITSRLHCASPCMAMGIPVILVRDRFDERYGWIDRYLHLYTPDEYDKIDWNPEPVDIEDTKKEIKAMAISMIKQQPDRIKLEKIHSYYMSRERKPLSASLMVRGYLWLSRYAPFLADFIRTKILVRFTIAGKTKSKGEDRK